MTFDLDTVVQIAGWVLGVSVLYFGLKARIDSNAKDKVDITDCLKNHGLNNLDHAEIKAELRVLKGGIRVLHQGLRDAGTLHNPPALPDEFYDDDREDG